MKIGDYTLIPIMENSQMTAAKTRESGVELLRMLLMFFIVMHHLVVHGSSLVNPAVLPATPGTYRKLWIEAFLLFPVDCFVFISGFYGIRLNLKKILQFWAQCLFYSLSILLVFSLFRLRSFGLKDVIFSFVPIMTGSWWFITTYFFLMLLAPALNLLTEKMPRSGLLYLVGLGALINWVCGFFLQINYLSPGGSSLVNFVFLYLLARYIARYEVYKNWKVPALLSVFLISSAAIALASVFRFHAGQFDSIWRYYAFYNPFIAFAAVSVFFIFRKMTFHSRVINWMGASAFGVYLVHDHRWVREIIYQQLFPIGRFSESASYLLWLLLFALIIFLCGILIDQLRKLLTEPLVNFMAGRKWFGDLDRRITGMKAD